MTLILLMTLLYASFIPQVNGSQLASVGVKTSPTTVSSTATTLTVWATILTQIPANGQIQITLPLDMSITSGTLSCSISDPSGITPTCTASQQVVTVITNKNIPVGYLQFSISNSVTNPKTIRPTSTFKLITQTSSGTQLDYLLQNIYLTATEGGLSSASMVASSDIVGTSTNLDIIFTTNHGIPAGGFIKVQFPKWNPNATVNSQQEYFPGSITCKTKYVLSNSLTCSFSNSILTISNSVSVDIGASIQMGFTVQGFRNPLSTAIVSGFTILTQDISYQSYDTALSGGNIDKATATLKVSTAASLSPSSIYVDYSVSSSIFGIVQETNKMRLSFTLPVDLNSNCKIKIMFPTQLSASTITSIETCSVFGPCTSTTFSYSSSTNQIAFTSCSSYTSNSMAALIKIDSLKLPSYTKSTDSLQIYVSDSSDNAIAQITSGITFTASAGIISTSSMSAVTSIVQTSSAIDISVQPSHSISTSSCLLITFSSAYSLPTSCSITNPVNVNSGASCTVTSGQYVLTNFLSSAYTGGSSTALSFRLNSITLPLTIKSNTGQSISYVVQVKDSTDNQFYTVDSLTTTDTITLQNGNILLLVSSSNPVAFAVTTYQFSITPDHKLTQDGYIQITYPSQITIPDASYSQSQCGSFVGFVTTVSCSVDTSNRLITLRNGFRLSTTPAASTKFSFTIPGVQNPANLQQTSTFSAYTFDSNAYSIDKVTAGVYVQMTNAAQMISASLSLGSYINADTTKYTFQMAASVPISSSNKIIIQFPSEVTLPTDESTLDCTTTDTQLFDSLKCYFYSSQTITNAIRVDINMKATVSQVAAGQSFSLTVNNIKNPISTKPSSTFAVTITDLSYQTVNSNPSSIQVATNTPHTIAQASITQADKGAAQTTTYTLIIYPENNINIGGGILIIFPSQVSIPGTLTVGVSSAYTRAVVSTSVDKSSRQVLITDAFQLIFKGTGTNAITITMNGFKNPINNLASSSFIIKTFNQETNYYYYIDQVTDGLVLNSACDYPCNTCDATKPATCLSCYDTNSLNKLQGTTCVSSCSTGKFYNTVSKKCEDCDSTCLGCVDSKSKCTSCGIGDNLYLFNNVCSSSCPSGYIPDANLNQCGQCSSQCATCQNTASTCTSCNTTSQFPYFNKQTCVKSCPSDISVLVGSTCTDCDTTCKTCSGSISHCTSCESYMKFDQVQNVCIKMCNQGTQIYDDLRGICQYCNENCATCTGNVTTCTTCISGLILNSDNVCRASCSSDSQTPINGVCKQCDLPCASCKGTTNHCTRCANDYLLYNTTCVQYCPEKFEANNATGQCILVGLLCPEGFTINEAGDGCIPNQIECKKGYMINKARTACVPAPGYPIPFPFLFLSVCLGLLVLGSYLKDKFFTKVGTSLIALLGSQEMLIYMLIVAYSGALQKWPAFILSVVAVLMLMTSNIAFYVIYKKDILSKDSAFTKWLRMYPKTMKYLPIIALVVNFKAIKLLYSGFFGLESCMASFEDPVKNFYKPLKMITYFSFIFVYAPILVADILIFMQVQWGYQLLILAIESFILALFVIVLTIIEFRQDPQKLFLSGGEQYVKIQPKSFDSHNVMGGIDMDESTLVRSRVADDDYEIQLRKKALATILSQVGKNFLIAQKQGVNLGGQIDKCMTKFDEQKLKLRRAFSLEEIKEEESWYMSEQEEDNEDVYDSDDSRQERLQRRNSFPLLSKVMESIPNHQFAAQIRQIKESKKRTTADNVYAECKPEDRKPEVKKKKSISRRTQTYLRELLCDDEDDLQESDLEVVMEDEAEIDLDYAKGLINNVISGLSESESMAGLGIPTGRDKKKGKNKKKKKEVAQNRVQEIPDFELVDIMGEFEIDDLGNFIILRGERGELLDKKERRVNRRGYLVDRFGNIINNKGQIIFKAVELDSDDEIPAPFGFEKRKKNLLNMPDEGDFKVHGEKPVDDDEEMIERELKEIKKSKKKNRRVNADGSIVEEDNDDGESSMDSLMADSPGKYHLNANNEDMIIDRVTKQKIPKKKNAQINSKLQQQSFSRQGANASLDGQNSNKGGGKSQNQPPRRIKRDDTRELFPTLAVESAEQRKLFKIAESIGGFANQLADEQRKKMRTIEPQSSSLAHDKLERLKQEHFKDILNDTNNGGGYSKQSSMEHGINRRVLPEAGIQALQFKQKNQISDKRLPPRNPQSMLEKVYGNVGDMVNYEERQILENMRLGSPASSQMASTLGFGSRPETSVYGDRRMKGLESIYMQKFDKKSTNRGIKKRTKAKFRSTLNQFVDDPEYFVNDGYDQQRQNEMSLMVAGKLDKLQKQYLSSTSTNRFQSAMGGNSNPLLQQTSQHFNKKNESVSGSVFNKDLASLDTIKKGNWMDS